METYSVTFYDKDDNWEDRIEDLDTYDAALKTAQASTREGGRSVIYRVVRCAEVTWSRKFKVT